MRYVTLDEVVANALTIMPQADDETRVAMRQWVYLAKRKLGPSKGDLRVATIGISNNRIRKPDDFIFATDLALLDDSGNERNYQFEGRGFAVHDENTGRRQPWVEAHYVSEDNDFYYLSITGDTNVTRARLEYLALPLDDGGNLMINEHETEAIMSYLRYMFAMREQDPNINVYREISTIEMARTRRKNEIPDMLEAKEGIFRKYMSMITKPLRDAY